jgi:hypothetical protein
MGLAYFTVPMYCKPANSGVEMHNQSLQIGGLLC